MNKIDFIPKTVNPPSVQYGILQNNASIQGFANNIKSAAEIPASFNV